MLWGNCDAQFTPRPLGPLRDIASQLHGSLARLLSAGADRSEVFVAVLDELSRRPTIVVFEDVHWADEPTLDLLSFLARRVGARPALLLLTFRDDELGPRHPLRLLLGELATLGHVRRVNLPPLSEPAVRSMIGDRSLDPGELHRQTAGNPFFVTEVLANPGHSVPPTARDAVLARAARLSRSAREVLQAAAVLGPRVRPSTLIAMGFGETASIDECLSLGMLIGQSDALAFRHELARQAILEAISPVLRVRLHRQALHVLLADAPERRDPVRLAYHAHGADDCEAVLLHAPTAARQTAAATGHRQAAALYRLALGCADRLPVPQRAALLEAYSWECNVIDQRSEAIAARETAVALWQAAGNRVKQAENLARLVPMLIGVGRNLDAERSSREAVTLLEPLPLGPEFALACRTQALVALARRDADAAIRWGERAIGLARQCGDDDVAGMTESAVGSAWAMLDYERGRAYLDRRLNAALAEGRATHAANLFVHLGQRAAELHQFEPAEHYLTRGLAFTDGRDLDIFHLLLLAWRSVTLMYLARWDEAELVCRRVLMRAGMSAANRLPALVALGRLRARAGMPDAAGVLDEALAVASAIGTSDTLGAVRAARAEHAWVNGDHARTRAEACAAYELAVREHHTWVAGELAYWRWQAGDVSPMVDWLPEPFACEIAGEWRSAATAWRRLNCRYEEARALASGDEEARRTAHQRLQQLGARGAARRLGRAMRSAGLTGIPRGPYASTRANPFGLTPRQLDILRLLAAELGTNEIADQLSIAPKTVDHHVAAVLAKLEVHSRKAAVTRARRSGVLSEK